ncbi:PepSY-associated TM helix domain-containing protein [Adhaeribacter rhizoryzae]|uniref:PepSY domain-containing protein n=1 Tax=Adhaeribacter rhizoryzae TaxID=2607907 RepID=A0A5M6D2F1_9BACT|nr:PepSY-associated TM helix domain-containing protein [Adhaeribacter rhizoryzae]KAA5541664.1 PepSY domain-containing protein [Adhaeribacter rhizoryzae]
MISKKTNNPGVFRRLNDWLHLWLGLISGIVVFIVSITGCFYAFQQEIKDALEPWRFVEVQEKSFVPPSQLLDTAMAYMPGSKPTGLTYSNREGAAAVGFSSFENGERSFTAIFLNPYTGEFLQKQQSIGKGEFDFFRFIIDGHRALWLPCEIGRPIVGICTLIFLVLLITGLVMWWPKRWNKSNIDKSLKIRWNGSFKRVNYDLHNVVGFYSLLLAFVLGVTGLVWSFKWFEDGLYYVTSGGQEKPGHHHPHSDVTKTGLLANNTVSVLDQAWYKTLAVEPNVQGMYMTPILEDKEDAIEIIAYQAHGSWYNRNEYYYDQYTLELFRVQGDRYAEAGFADQLSMLNYDIHIGAVWGLPGKILAFCISLICASLPITGFLVWWNKKKKPKKKVNPLKSSENIKARNPNVATV